MKNRKGFTLVELLAVIAILAIIALIAIFSMTQIKSLYSKKAFTISVKNLLTAAQNYYADDGYNYDITEISINKIAANNKSEYTSGTIKLIDSKLEVVNISNGEYCANGPLDNLSITFGTCGNYYLYYQNGDVVYLDPQTGNKCTSYKKENSITGSITGCMKWYVFNDDITSNTVNLILDHNTSEKVSFAAANSVIIEDTNLWKRELKYRLITADEISKITNNPSFSSNNISYYFDSLSLVPKTSCKIGNTSYCNYGWLYDRTNDTCKDYGCLNNSTVNSNGYWTSSRLASDSSLKWYIDYTGKLSYAGDSVSNIGIRPAITVNKIKIK